MNRVGKRAVLGSGDDRVGSDLELKYRHIRRPCLGTSKDGCEKAVLPHVAGMLHDHNRGVELVA